MVADNGYLTSADLVGVGGAGTVIYTRCAWTGATMPTTGSCTPPACPSVWEDLGVTGNVKTGLAAHASTDYSPSYSESSGYQERACYLANPRTVLTTRCAWTGAIARDIESCTRGVPDGLDGSRHHRQHQVRRGHVRIDRLLAVLLRGLRLPRTNLRPLSKAAQYLTEQP